MKLRSDKWLRSAGRQMLRMMGVLVLIAGTLCAVRTRQAYAAVSTTTVQGTVYLANGDPGSGMVHVSWPAFMTANGQAIVADSVDVTIGQDGFLSVNLTPNLGAMPSGLYYTAVFYMSDGTVSTQYWVVPAAAQASLAQVQAQVMPAAQAVQAVNKTYVDQAIAQISQSMLTGSGGTLNGPLYLSGDPTQPLQAADKHYVDLAVGQTGSGAVNPASPGQIAYYAEDGKSISGMSTVPVSAGGTGSTTASDALQNLGGISATSGSAQTLSGPLHLSGPYDSSSTNPNQAATAQNVQNVAPRSVKEFGAKGDGKFSDFKMVSGSNVVQLVDVVAGSNFTAADVGKRIMLPFVDSDGKALYTTITGYTDSTHVTVAANASNSFDGTGAWTNQALWGTDDLASLNAAMAAAGEGRTYGAGLTREGGATLFFPCGYYVVSGQVQISNGVDFEGLDKHCAILVDMGTTAHDATVEIANGVHSTWLVNGLYMNPDYNNHPEIGACTGGTCSPAIPSGSGSASVSNLTIYANKYASWALSSLFVYNSAGANVNLYGGNKGCFYSLNQVNVTDSQYFCGPDNTFGHGNPVNGFYLDSSAPGVSTVPMRIESPWITNVSGVALTANYLGQATIADAQISSNHQNLDLRSTSAGITFTGGLAEGGAPGQVADVIASAYNIFENVGFSGVGITLSGNDNVFKGGMITGGQTVAITGMDNSFENVATVDTTVFEDSSQTTRYSGMYDYANAYTFNRPTSEEAVQTGGGASDLQSVTRVTGTWRASTIPLNVTNTIFSTGQSWKALLTGNWFYYGMVQDVPATVELTESANTVVVGPITFTFSIGTGGHFQVAASSSENWARFSGVIVFMPRAHGPGDSGVNSVKYAGNVQAPSIRVASGTAVTDNQGNGAKLQHSTGGTTTDHLAKFDANGNIVDAGAGMPSGSPDPSTQVNFFDDFITASNVTASNLGSPSGPTCAVNFVNGGDIDTPGILTISSGNGAAGSGEFCVNQSFGHPLIPANSGTNPWRWKEVLGVKVLPSVTAAQYAVGRSRSSGVTSPLGFILDSSNAQPDHWYCRAYSATSVDSGVTATVARQALSMYMDGSFVHWYINGSEVCSPMARTSLGGSLLPPDDLVFGAAVTQSAGTAVSLTVDYVSYSVTLTRP